MNRNLCIRNSFVILLCIIMMFNFFTVTAENERASSEQKVIEAAYATPVIDGQIEQLWDTTNYTFIDKVTPSGEYSYTGWMKALWDDDKLYVLAKIHTVALSADESVSAWKQDCLEVFLDENLNRSSVCQDDDYQLRSNFEGRKTAKNYDIDNMEVATDTFDMGYVVEMAFPMKSVTLKNGLKMGFDAQVYRTGNFAVEPARYGWNAIRSDISSSTVDYGTIILNDKVNVVDTVIPEYTPPIQKNMLFSVMPSNEGVELIKNVSAMYDYSGEQIVDVLHVNEYPCMEINVLGSLIGATVVGGDTLVKDGIQVKYTAGSRLMQDNKGNIIMLCEATSYNGKLYVPISSLETTFIYDTEYNRFKKELDIIPSHEPAEAEVVVYAKDYGAVGDGVHDDKEALLAAFYDAINSGKPARLELEPNKKYYVSETNDNAHMFWITGVQDFVFNGNGSTLLLDPAQMSAFAIGKSARVRIENLIIDSIAPASTQGWIRELNEKEGYIIVEFEDGYPAMAPAGWVTANRQELNYLSPIQAGTSHSKYVRMDYSQFEGMEPIGDGLYKVKMDSNTGIRMIPLLDVGDRFSMNYTYQNYDLRKHSKMMWDSGMFHIATSGDIELRNINTRVAKYLGVSMTFTWGNIKLNNFSSYSDDGRIWSNGRDFVHTISGRGTLLFENSTVVGIGDDAINTKDHETTFIENLGDRWYRMQNNTSYMQGDELIIFDRVNKVILGRAFVEDVEYLSNTLNAERAKIKLDRDIEGIITETDMTAGQTATVSYNVSTAFTGTVVRNNTFKNGKRWVWVNRSPNCLFEDNSSENMNGSMIAGENELSSREGPFPSAFTIRNNDYYCDGNGTSSSDPIQIRSTEANSNSTPAVDGVLIEGNRIETSRVGTIINVSNAKDLYLINNTIINNGENGQEDMPVKVQNSSISLIDKLYLNYKNKIDVGVNVAGCSYDENSIVEGGIVGENIISPFKDWSE